MFVRKYKGPKPESPCARDIVDPSLDGERRRRVPVANRDFYPGVRALAVSALTYSRETMAIGRGFPFFVGAGRKVMMIQEAKKETREEAIASINAEYDAKMAELEKQKDDRWGPQIVPGLRILFEPDAYMADENGKEIEGTRGHSHTIIYDAPECSRIHSDESVSLLLDIDDRDGPSVRDVAAARIREEAYKLLDLADELSPDASPDINWEPPQPKPEDMLPPLYVEISGGDKEKRYATMEDPRNTFMATFEELNPGRKCRALAGIPAGQPTSSHT